MPPGCLDDPQGASPTNRRRDLYDTPVPDILGRGRRFFDGCYGKVAPRVMTSLDSCGTEDLGLAVRLAYGYLLSTTSVLSEAETSFIMIAGLIPQDVSRTLHNLPRGLVRRRRHVSAMPGSRRIRGWGTRPSGEKNKTKTSRGGAAFRREGKQDWCRARASGKRRRS